MIRIKIREFAKAKGLSQAKLSRRADVDLRTIQRIYRDPHTIITLESLDRLARALNIDASVLIENDPPLPKTLEESNAAQQVKEEIKFAEPDGSAPGDV